jgi:hypothetical protein
MDAAALSLSLLATFAELELKLSEFTARCTALSVTIRSSPICWEMSRAACMGDLPSCGRPGVYAQIMERSTDHALVVRAALRIAEIHSILARATVCAKLPRNLDPEQTLIYREELRTVASPWIDTAEPLLKDIALAARDLGELDPILAVVAVAEARLKEARACAGQ